MNGVLQKPGTPHATGDGAMPTEARSREGCTEGPKASPGIGLGGMMPHHHRRAAAPARQEGNHQGTGSGSGLCRGGGPSGVGNSENWPPWCRIMSCSCHFCRIRPLHSSYPMPSAGQMHLKRGAVWTEWNVVSPSAVPIGIAKFPHLPSRIPCGGLPPPRRETWNLETRGRRKIWRSPVADRDPPCFGENPDPLMRYLVFLKFCLQGVTAVRHLARVKL